MFPKAAGLQRECPALTQPSDATALQTASVEFLILVGNRSMFTSSTPPTGSPVARWQTRRGDKGSAPSSEGLTVTELLDHR